MAFRSNWLILATLTALGWGRVSRADEPAPQAEVTAPVDLSEDELAELLEGQEVVEIVAERPDKPFDRPRCIMLGRSLP